MRRILAFCLTLLIVCCSVFSLAEEEVQSVYTLVYPAPSLDEAACGIAAIPRTEEAVFSDEEGNKWIELADGSGFIYAAEAAPVVFACHAALLDEDQQPVITITAEESDFPCPIALAASKQVTNVTLCHLVMTEEGYCAAAPIMEIPLLPPNIWLEVNVTFWGDMTAFGLSYTDESGVTYQYMLMMSGRNGDIVCCPAVF